jgi:hypothetical protein
MVSDDECEINHRKKKKR